MTGIEKLSRKDDLISFEDDLHPIGEHILLLKEVRRVPEVNRKYEVSTTDRPSSSKSVAPFVPEERFDLKYLAPISVIDSNNNWPNPITSFTTELNKNFHGTGFTNQDIFSEHFLFNKDNQFVWTNQLVIKNGTKVATRNDTKVDKSINFEKCNLRSPNKSFYLKRRNRLGFGLFAKQFIPKGLYSYTVFSKFKYV